MNDRVSRRLVHALLGRTRHGSLTLVEGDKTLRFGDREPGGPMVTVDVRSPGFYRALLGGSIGLSDAYMDGMFECAELPELARLAALNMPQLDAWRRALRPVV
ncbi:MAG: cyclopropane-fatty-acyl-phospholipid synthase, partial [Solirubrobacteraceae bacterium]|nr:cyclopropane-fatty-acyl-phospholipid synthase [Solirubrobacteraceae bacterium]